MYTDTNTNMPGNIKKPKVYLTRRINKEAFDVLKESCEVTSWNGSEPVPREELLNNIAGKQALLCMLTDRIDEEVLAKATDLKVVSTISVGYDHLSLAEIKKRNIRVGYTPDVLTDATAELTVALLLATSRRLFEANDAARRGEWKLGCFFWMTGQSLANATVGIVGFGRIGQAVGKLLLPFKIDALLYHSRTEKRQEAQRIGAHYVSFETLCRESDFIIVTCALTPETKGMFDRRAFSTMKSSCVFVNTSRGGVVDQDALIDALKYKMIGAAGLDVTTPEPLPLDSPLFKLENCVVSPHIGSASVQARNWMAQLSVKNVIAALAGQKMPAELKL